MSGVFVCTDRERPVFVMEVKNANVARFLPQMALEQPEGIAVRIAEGRSGEKINYRTFTFAELDRLSDQAAGYFRKKEIKQGTRTLLMVKPGLELILTTFALFKIGAVPVVIDPGMGLKGFLSCVKRTQPEALIGISLAVAIRHLFRNSFNKVRTTIRVGKSFCSKISKSGSIPQELFIAASTDMAAILFTSGSTGPAKGVCYQHGMFDAQVRMIRDAYDIKPGEVDLPMLPVFALFNPALGMATIVPEMNPSRPASVDPAKIVQAIQQNNVTNSFGSPVLWTKIGRYCVENNITLPTIKRILMAGAAVPPSLIQMYRSIIPNGMIHTPYGATESLPVATIDGDTILQETLELTEQGKGSCVGYPVPGVEIRVIRITDEVIEFLEQAEFVSMGEVGEIIVRGDVVTREYDQLPDATSKAKIRDHEGHIWHRMGDVGYIDQQGRLWFCGRKAERVETSEGLIYTDCCEAVFNKLPWVYRSALIGLGKRGEEVPAIVIEPEKGLYPVDQKIENMRLEELRRVALSYEHTKAIKIFFFKESFPVDVRHNAKIHRLTLKKEFEEI